MRCFLKFITFIFRDDNKGMQWSAWFKHPQVPMPHVNIYLLELKCGQSQERGWGTQERGVTLSSWLHEHFNILTLIMPAYPTEFQSFLWNEIILYSDFKDIKIFLLLYNINASILKSNYFYKITFLSKLVFYGYFIILSVVYWSTLLCKDFDMHVR